MPTCCRCVTFLGVCLSDRGAVGTGLTATPEVAQETHAYIRSWFVDNYSQVSLARNSHSP